MHVESSCCVHARPGVCVCRCELDRTLTNLVKLSNHHSKVDLADRVQSILEERLAEAEMDVLPALQVRWQHCCMCGVLVGLVTASTAVYTSNRKLL